MDPKEKSFELQSSNVSSCLVVFKTIEDIWNEVLLVTQGNSPHFNNECSLCCSLTRVTTLTVGCDTCDMSHNSASCHILLSADHFHKHGVRG